MVGDVICLGIGDQVPADGLFLDGHSLKVDKSSMTGESDHVEVNCSHPFLVSGAKEIQKKENTREFNGSSYYSCGCNSIRLATGRHAHACLFHEENDG